MAAYPVALGHLEERLRDLVKIPSRASYSAARRIKKLIDRQYADGRDPYGQPWAPLQPWTLAKGRKPPPLTDTGTMRRETVVFPIAGSGIQIVIYPDYAKFAQFGWVHHWSGLRVPARPLLPGGKALPKAWEEQIRIAIKRAYYGEKP